MLRLLRSLFDKLSWTLPRCRSRGQACPFLASEYGFKADFPKSRVHAKLLKPLILKCYQTIIVHEVATISNGPS